MPCLRSGRGSSTETITFFREARSHFIPLINRREREGEGGREGGVKFSLSSQVLQLYQITLLHHGLMMVGPSGSGKSTAWRVLLKALERLEGVEGVAHIIDPKAISKEDLYGVLDPNTREWTDGLFTHILRK
jgi:dynein heavy chain 1